MKEMSKEIVMETVEKVAEEAVDNGIVEDVVCEAIGMGLGKKIIIAVSVGAVVAASVYGIATVIKAKRAKNGSVDDEESIVDTTVSEIEED